MFDLTSPIYTDANKAREHLEAIQWPGGPVCPHCGNSDATRITKLKGRSTRPGVHKCKECQKPFSVTVGTVFERSHIPLNKWVLATHLMAASKKGISAHQLHRMLGVTYKTAWFMNHRIREAMKEDVASSGPLGGSGKEIEADETYYGKREDQTRPDPAKHGNIRSRNRPSKAPIKITVVSLVERGGKVRSFHVKNATRETVQDILFRNVDRKSKLYTDESKIYKTPGKDFEKHRTVNHSAEEWARREDHGYVHTNTIENVFSVFKRGMHGIYQHCAEKHLHRYLAEFDFRYNRRAALKISDNERARQLLEGIRGKRLTYRRIGEALNG
jgi:transposase-like protein